MGIKLEDVESLKELKKFLEAPTPNDFIQYLTLIAAAPRMVWVSEQVESEMVNTLQSNPAVKAFEDYLRLAGKAQSLINDLQAIPYDNDHHDVDRLKYLKEFSAIQEALIRYVPKHSERIYQEPTLAEQIVVEPRVNARSTDPKKVTETARRIEQRDAPPASAVSFVNAFVAMFCKEPAMVQSSMANEKKPVNN